MENSRHLYLYKDFYLFIYFTFTLLLLFKKIEINKKMKIKRTQNDCYMNYVLK